MTLVGECIRAHREPVQPVVLPQPDVHVQHENVVKEIVDQELEIR